MVQRLFVVLLVCVLVFAPPVVAQDTAQTNVTIHVVQRGENLFRIALHYSTTIEVLTQLNGITLADNIFVGQRLLVPTTSIAAGDQQVHIVQPGESLASIAALYGMTPEALAAQNEITEQSGFYVGLALIVVPVDTLPPETSEIADTASDVAAPPLVHVVQPGETLFRIATRYGTTVNELATANSISDPETIYAGQQLIIPGVTPPQLALDLPAPLATFDVYPLVLVEGETGRIRLTSSAAVTMSGTFLDRTMNDAPDANNTRHTFYVGIPVGTAAGVYPLNLTVTDAVGAQSTFTANVQIVAGGYWREYITVLADRIGLLDPAIDDAELALLRGVMNNFTPTRYFDAPMGLPAAAPLSSRFGNLRSYNGGAFERT
ncbi:MAG: LysM peptidoglycan-binding domain-containing protein, partial [Anaerolinea sp.]|nr:LysM peptidoglycan-binding domain-containing protein [Anaerolinea sp.]